MNRRFTPSYALYRIARYHALKTIKGERRAMQADDFLPILRKIEIKHLQRQLAHLRVDLRDADARDSGLRRS